MELSEELIEELKITLDSLIAIKTDNFQIFAKTYKSLPFYLYEHIENLSASNQLFIGVCVSNQSMSQTLFTNQLNEKSWMKTKNQSMKLQIL